MKLDEHIEAKHRAKGVTVIEELKLDVVTLRPQLFPIEMPAINVPIHSNLSL